VNIHRIIALQPNLAQQWFDETASRNLYATIGIHPHDAETVKQMKLMRW
jgi:Tat protein secretion system quality control protein TatD with DNase activity